MKSFYKILKQNPDIEYELFEIESSSTFKAFNRDTQEAVLNSDGENLVLMGEDANFGRRLLFYKKWCLENRRMISFDLFFFNDNKFGDILVRRCAFQLLQEDKITLRFFRSVDIEDSTFRRSLRVLDNVQDPVLVTEADLFDLPGPRILYANSAFYKLSGYSREEVLGQSPRMLQGEEMSQNELNARKNIRDKITSWQDCKQVVKNFTKEGNPFSVELNISPVADETGWWTHWVSVQRDVTHVRLRESAYNLMQKSGNIGHWTLKVRTGEVVLSPQVLEIHGIKEGDITNANEGIAKFFPEHEQKRLVQCLEDCITKKIPYDEIFEFIDAKGSKKWIRGAAEPLIEESGEVFEIFGIMQDLTTFIEEKKKYQNLVDNSPDIIFQLDLEGNFTYVSKVWTQILGHSREEIIGTNFRAIVHPEDIEKCEQALGAIVLGHRESVMVDYRVFTKEGKVRTHRTNGVKLEVGNSAFQGIASDITDIKELEEENQAILSATKVGVFSWDLISNDLTWNDSMFEVYEMDKHAFSGNFNDWVNTVHPDSQEQVSEAIEKALSGEKDFDEVFRVTTGKGNTKYVQGIVTLEQNSKGENILMRGVNIDKTEEVLREKEAEEQKRQSIIQSRFASIGELASGVGHEINNPLAIALGSLRQLKRKQPNIDKELLSNTEEALNRISAITKGLRTLSRHESEKATFNLSEAIEESISFVQGVYRARGVAVSFYNELSQQISSGGFIHANRAEIQQIIMNLMSNAFDATEGVEERQITISLKCNGHKAVVEVKDNGHGIAEKDQGKIFESFFTTKEVGQGVGIGLSISKSIAENNSAQLAFSSTEGKGTSFYLTMTLTEESREEFKGYQEKAAPAIRPLLVNGETPHGQEAPQRGRVLVVDDEEGIRFLLKNCLEEHGFVCDTAECGLDALESILKHKKSYDVIVSDMRMPRITGLDMAKRLAEASKGPLPEIFLITGGVNEDEEELNNQSYIKGLFFKPFDEEEIIKKIVGIMGEKTA